MYFRGTDEGAGVGGGGGGEAAPNTYFYNGCSPELRGAKS